MFTPNDAQLSSPTDCAVKVAAAVLLPAVFGFFVVQHLWLTPEATSQPPTVTAAVAGDSPQLNQQSIHIGGATAPGVTVAMEVGPATARVIPATLDIDVIAESHMSHAPLELTLAGRAIADPAAFAPATLPIRGQLSLRRELQNAATELDLYGSALRPENRFDRIRKEVTEKRAGLVFSRQEIYQTTALTKVKIRRTKSRRERRALQQELSAEIEKLRSENYNAADPAKPQFQPLKDWLVERDDLKGLPLAMGDECRLDAPKSANLQRVSMLFRNFRQMARFKQLNKAKNGFSFPPIRKFNWTEQDISGLMQIMTAEKTPMRLDLVNILAKLPCRESSIALARLATFDVSVEVREKAVVALNERPRGEFRGEFLAGLRYVWAPIANNAAEALVSLGDRDAYDQLADVARQSDPRAPYQTDDNVWAVHELVRVNHMRNCLLCHAPAVAQMARVTGSIPSPYDPLPVPYYDRRSDYSVRADVTYLRQDFSVVHPVADHGPLPAEQRFDYFVRERKLSEQAAAELSRRFSNELYPQRAAVLFAMRMLRRSESRGGRPAPAEPLLSSAD